MRKNLLAYTAALIGAAFIAGVVFGALDFIFGFGFACMVTAVFSCGFGWYFIARATGHKVKKDTVIWSMAYVAALAMVLESLIVHDSFGGACMSVIIAFFGGIFVSAVVKGLNGEREGN
jgi:hypothetical protein